MEIKRLHLDKGLSKLFNIPIEEFFKPIEKKE